MSATRCTLKAKELPGMFGGGGREVVNCAVYLLNRSVSKGAGARLLMNFGLEALQLCITYAHLGALLM
jgi:hypothetical protein